MNEAAKTPLISVIIPAYNAEHTIERACRSVLEQTYTHIELLVVDDGSRDTTGAIVKQMADKDNRIRYFYQENGGVCKARNAGLDHVSGVYVFFLDADDEMVSDCLEKLLRIAQNQGGDMVSGVYDTVRNDGNIVHQRYDEECIWKGQEAFVYALKDHPAAYSACGKLYRTSILKSVRFVEGRRIHEDSFFLFEVFQQDLTVVVTNTLAFRLYMTENSASRSRFGDKFLDILYFAYRKYGFVEENCPEHLNLAQNMLVKANMACLRTMWSATDPKFKETERQCLKVVRENASYFIPAIKVDKIMFWIIQMRLFWLYKFAMRIVKR